MKTLMSSLFQYKIKTFWKQQTANKTVNSKQRQHVFSHLTETETPLPCGQTDTCENITLPQTSFAGGN